jgi:hypothetical protein
MNRPLAQCMLASAADSRCPAASLDEHRFGIEGGKVRLLVGALSSDFRLRKTVQVSGDLALPPDLLQDHVSN